MNTDTWQSTDIECCPNCFGDLEICTSTGKTEVFNDGDLVRCIYCNFDSVISVDENGDAWVQEVWKGYIDGNKSERIEI